MLWMTLLLAGSGLTNETAGDRLVRTCVSTAVVRAQTQYWSTVELVEDHSTWETAWEVSSDHYRVRTTHSHFLAQDLAQGLESMLAHYQSLFGTDFAPARPLPVFVHETIAEYNQFGNDHGAEHSSILGAFYASQHPEAPVAAVYTANSTLLRMSVTHAATHQFVEAAFGNRPAVPIDEGLASYFSLFWDWGYGASEHRRFQERDSFLPLARLLREDLADYVSNPHDRFMQLGMFFHYLLNVRESTRTASEGATPPFMEYVRAVVRGQDPRTLPFAELLASDLETLEADFRETAFE